MPPALSTLEAIVDASGVAEVIEGRMPTGGRPRQLPVRSLLVGALVAVADGRPAHLRRVHAALVALPADDQARLDVVVPTRRGPHTLTYRQVERTFSSMVATMDLPAPSGADVESSGCEDRLASFCDALVEASVPATHARATTSVAVDWTDHETWSRSADADAVAADPDASWGHRKGHAPGATHELFFGYYAQAVTMVPDEAGPAVPELIRRIALHAPSVDPPTAVVTVLERMAEAGIAVGDVLADSGYAHRLAERWATPLRRLGARLIQDLHPHDRGPKGTFAGATLHNGNLYCPATPEPLFQLGPLHRAATAEETALHDEHCAELARYKLARISADDADGYHRVECPAAAGKLRCALKERSMSLGFEHPEVLVPPGEPPTCCRQQTVTVGPTVNAKTRQKHDYPSPAHRVSYTRRTGAERSFSTLKDPASTDVRRGWCRLMGRAKNLVMLSFAAVVRNLRVLASFERRMAQEARGASVRPARRRRSVV